MTTGGNGPETKTRKMQPLRGRTALTITVLALLLGAGVSVPPHPRAAAPADPDEEQAVEALAASNNAFALDLYRELGIAGDNLFFSPLSIFTALAMTFEGSEGTTREEMAAVLHLSSAYAPADAMSALIRRLAPPPTEDDGGEGEAPGEGRFELTVANRLWGQRGYQFYDSFLDLLDEKYGAGLTEADFRNAADEAAADITRWVEETTRGRIRNMAPPGSLSPLTTLVLVNAIYFKAAWTHQFAPEATVEQPFWISAGESVPVPTMNRTRGFGYAETDDAQVLEMPYRGGELAMVVLLPRERDGLPAVEDGLTSKSLGGILDRLRSREVAVALPRFSMTTAAPLKSVLQSRGMEAAFVQDVADFKRISLNPDLFISDVLHKAFVAVDEEGTEAAAATSVTMELTSIMPVEPVAFTADHPFLFLILDRRSGSILFMGRVSDPSV